MSCRPSSHPPSDRKSCSGPRRGGAPRAAERLITTDSGAPAGAQLRSRAFDVPTRVGHAL